MVKKRIEKDGLIKCIFESTNILASTYDKNNSNLTVIFGNGGSYTYTGVKNTDYLRFETDESQGKAITAYIKQYPFIKNEKIDVQPIKEQLDIAIKSEKLQIAKEMVESMSKLVSLFENEEVIGLELLKNVEINVSLFKKINNVKDE